jgi:hypothetical protein
VEADDTARQQREEQEAVRRAAVSYPTSDGAGQPLAEAPGAWRASTPAPQRATPAVRRGRRYHGAVRLDTLRMAREAGQIAEAILQHLAGLPGAKVSVALEIQAELPDGAPDHVVRTVTENSRTLKFESFGFEEE